MFQLVKIVLASSNDVDCIVGSVSSTGTITANTYQVWRVVICRVVVSSYWPSNNTITNSLKIV